MGLCRSWWEETKVPRGGDFKSLSNALLYEWTPGRKRDMSSGNSVGSVSKSEDGAERLIEVLGTSTSFSDILLT